MELNLEIYILVRMANCQAVCWQDLPSDFLQVFWSSFLPDCNWHDRSTLRIYFGMPACQHNVQHVTQTGTCVTSKANKTFFSDISKRELRTNKNTRKYKNI